MKNIFITLVVLTCSSVGNAMPPPPPPPPSQAINPAAVHTMHHSAAPSYTGSSSHYSDGGLMTATQYYSNSVKGLRTYAEDIRYTQPEVYSRIDQDILDLEIKERNSNYASWAVTGLGVVMMAGAFTFAQSETEDLFGDKKKETNIGLFASGAAVIVGGKYVIRRWYSVDQDDIRSVINTHNRINSANPLRLSMHYDAQQGSPIFNLALAF